MIDRMRRLAAALVALALGLNSTSAFAGSAAQPGQTIGLPVGAQLPVGLLFLNTSSFGVRDTDPRSTENNINLPGIVWTPGDFLGGRLNLIYIQPVAATSARGAPYQSGIGVPLLAAQLAWKLAPGLGFSYLFGGYLPIQTQFLINNASLSHRFGLTYNADGYNLTANLLYGNYFDTRNAQGVTYPDYLNLDLTATKKFGNWEIGPVAFASTDLPTSVFGYRRQSQIAVGGLVGYNFGPAIIQGYVTRDIVERNYGGYDTRGWLRAIVPLYKAPEPSAPEPLLVKSRF